MKKVILALGLLLAVGGGCISAGKLGNKTVDGDWFLAFDLPSDWVMAEPYQEPNTEAVIPSLEVDRTNNEVYIQSTNKAISGGSVAPEPNVAADSYVRLQPDHGQIRVSRLDPARLIPSEAEDLGDGFSRVDWCDHNDVCVAEGRHIHDYYLQTNDAKYKFIVYGDDIETMEDIIMSAEVVTETDED